MDFALEKLTPPFVLLEDRLRPERGGRLFTRPRAIVRCDEIDGVEIALHQVERGLAQGLHAAGFLSYELGYALERSLAPLMPGGRDTPLLWFGLFEPPAVVSAEALDRAFAALGPPPPITALSFGDDRSAYVDKVGEVRRRIEAGEVYQVNLTFPLRFHYDGPRSSLYGALRSRQPVSHGGLVALEDMTVLSVSPELWVSVEGERATTRPMKGTSARGADAEADRIAREILVADPKQRAENLMIVDLLRNDLARISTPGSVTTPALFTVETYPSFHALTSTIEGRLAPGLGLEALIAALFPCGSIVGAPKIRAAQIIRSLEETPRGVYSGALGALSPDGDLAFNVAIRTAVLRSDGAGRYGVGGGITAGSDPDAEFEEARLKARVLTDLAEPFGLIETFRWSRDLGFVRLDLHLDRLAGSALQLGFAFDRSAAVRALERLAGHWTGKTGDQRVRLQLARDGVLEVAYSPAATSEDGLKVCLSAGRLDPGDPFLRHKTTRREIYDRAFDAAAARGFDEVVFLNRRGEVAEASRNTVFVELDGRLVTPPLSSGVLPGVLRRHLLDSGRAREAVLSPDLLASRPFQLGNSLHGLRTATLTADDA